MDRRSSPHSARVIDGLGPAVFDASRRRAASQTAPSATAIAADAGPLTVDLQTAPIGYHYVMDAISAIGIATVNQPMDSPLAGLYLVKEGSSLEPLATMNTGDGADLTTRCGVHLPVDVLTVQLAAAAGTRFAFSYRARLSMPLVVPHGYVVRFMCNLLPGTAAPGPGANSSVQLQAQASLEPD